MVSRLSDGDATVGQLAEPYEMSVQAVYKHLRVLEDAGLVSRPAGPQPRAVHLEAGAFDLMDAWIERYRARAEQQNRRLDVVLAAMDDASPAAMEGDEDDGDRRRGRPGPAGDPDDS